MILIAVIAFALGSIATMATYELKIRNMNDKQMLELRDANYKAFLAGWNEGVKYGAGEGMTEYLRNLKL
jgi:hypothetical protein